MPTRLRQHRGTQFLTRERAPPPSDRSTRLFHQIRDRPRVCRFAAIRVPARGGVGVARQLWSRLRGPTAPLCRDGWVADRSYPAPEHSRLPPGRVGGPTLRRDRNGHATRSRKALRLQRRLPTGRDPPHPPRLLPLLPIHWGTSRSQRLSPMDQFPDLWPRVLVCTDLGENLDCALEVCHGVF
jgi:hypothetical protein